MNRMNFLFPSERALGGLGLALFLWVAPALANPDPVPAPAASPADPTVAALAERWPTLSEAARKEYAYGLAQRDKWLPKLPKGAVTVLDLPYEDNPVEGRHPASVQKLDLYVPPGEGPFPLVVWIHGGAWKGGNKEQGGAYAAAQLLPEGIALASIDYRFVADAPFPGMFQDCIDAVAFLRSHAATYRLDPARVGVWGESAGGHAAGVVAMAEGDTRFPNSGPPVQAAVLWYGFYDLTQGNKPISYSSLYGNRGPYDEAAAKQISPVYLIHPGVPPVLIARGDQDTTAPLDQSEKMAAALKEAGVDVTFTKYPAYAHNLWHPDSLAEVVAFFKLHLQKKDG
jgi:acetyl esterase/lipase